MYVSTDEQAVIDGTAAAETVSQPSYDAAVELGQTYYWKVDEVNDVEDPAVWSSEVWTFSVAESIVVDDFETYNDTNNHIYDTWLDGWVNETGSTVGYLNAPFAETTLAHSGGQSMPLAYENTNGATISERSARSTSRRTGPLRNPEPVAGLLRRPRQQRRTALRQDQRHEGSLRRLGRGPEDRRLDSLDDRSGRNERAERYHADDRHRRRGRIGDAADRQHPRLSLRQ